MNSKGIATYRKNRAGWDKTRTDLYEMYWSLAKYIYRAINRNKQYVVTEKWHSITRGYVNYNRVELLDKNTNERIQLFWYATRWNKA